MFKCSRYLAQLKLDPVLRFVNVSLRTDFGNQFLSCLLKVKSSIKQLRSSAVVFGHLT